MICEQGRLGFSAGAQEDPDKQQEAVRKMMVGELKKSFKPEFLNRVDEIIVFHKLSQQEVRQIAGNMLDALKTRLAGLHIEISFDESAAEKITLDGFDPLYGARPLRRAIQQRVEDALSEEILSGKITIGDTVKMEVIDDKLTFTRVDIQN
jgi:ATP-dependent Clp protease ATP-binding subunit ClpC